MLTDADCAVRRAALRPGIARAARWAARVPAMTERCMLSCILTTWY